MLGFGLDHDGNVPGSNPGLNNLIIASLIRSSLSSRVFVSSVMKFANCKGLVVSPIS